MANEFNTIDKAVELLDYSLTITSNKKRYPSKYKELTSYIIKLNLCIFDLLSDANDKDLRTESGERYKLQTKAIRYCDRLSRMTELSFRRNLIGSDTLCHWQKLTNSVKYMTKGWRNSDAKRKI